MTVSQMVSVTEEWLSSRIQMALSSRDNFHEIKWWATAFSERRRRRACCVLCFDRKPHKNTEKLENLERIFPADYRLFVQRF